jgi:hypothetical protein
MQDLWQTVLPVFVHYSYIVKLNVKYPYCMHKRSPGMEGLTDIMEKTFPNSNRECRLII